MTNALARVMMRHRETIHFLTRQFDRFSGDAEEAWMVWLNYHDTSLLIRVCTSHEQDDPKCTPNSNNSKRSVDEQLDAEILKQYSRNCISVATSCWHHSPLRRRRLPVHGRTGDGPALPIESGGKSNLASLVGCYRAELSVRLTIQGQYAWYNPKTIRSTIVN